MIAEKWCLAKCYVRLQNTTSLSRATRYLLDNGRIDMAAVDALQAYHEGLRADGVVSTFQFEGVKQAERVLACWP